jgi:hypothetical protein
MVAAMGVWVLREREEERKEGFEVVVVAAMGVGEEERERKVISIVCGKVSGFSCKMPTLHVQIGGCKHGGFYTQFVLNLISTPNASMISHLWFLLIWAIDFMIIINFLFYRMSSEYQTL